MPQEKKREHKCKHHVAAANTQSRNVSWWHSFHFSGKVIMCSVLFGLGLVLIGGLILAIGMDRTEEPVKDNLDEIQNKAPMSIVGPVIMGIGSFTVIVGIVMCLFETDICRKREPDSRPLIEEQGTNSTSSDPNTMPSTSTKSENHRHHKKSSTAKKHRANKSKFESSGSISPTSRPIDVQRSSSRDLTASDKFLTPPSSFVPDNNTIQTDQNNAKNQTSTSLMKSLTSSGKSWNTSTEFRTPSSSFEDNSWSYDTKNKDREIPSESPDSEDVEDMKTENFQHEFLTPQNSSAGILDIKSSSEQKVLSDEIRNLSHLNPNLKALNESKHEFVTPVNSYVEKNSFPYKTIDEEALNIISMKKKDSNVIPVLEEREITVINSVKENVNIDKNVSEKNIEQKEKIETEDVVKSENNDRNLVKESGLSTKSHDNFIYANEVDDVSDLPNVKEEICPHETSVQEGENSFSQSHQNSRKESSNDLEAAKEKSAAISNDTDTEATNKITSKDSTLDNSLLEDCKQENS